MRPNVDTSLTGPKELLSNLISTSLKSETASERQTYIDCHMAAGESRSLFGAVEVLSSISTGPDPAKRDTALSSRNTQNELSL